MQDETPSAGRCHEQAIALLLDSGEIDRLTDILVGALREALAILGEVAGRDGPH